MFEDEAGDTCIDGVEDGGRAHAAGDHEDFGGGTGAAEIEEEIGAEFGAEIVVEKDDVGGRGADEQAGFGE